MSHLNAERFAPIDVVAAGPANGAAMKATRATSTAPSAAPPPTAQELLRQFAAAPPQRVYPTRLGELDRLLSGGLRSRQLAILVAPPGAGKTALAMVLAREALGPNLPVLIVQLELPGEEVAARLAAPLVGVTVDAIMTGQSSAEDAAEALDRAQADAEGWPIFVRRLRVRQVADPLEAIRTDAEAIRETTGHAPAVIVDYVQLLATDDPDRRRLSVSAIAAELAELAEALDVPVLGISSTARGYYAPGAKKRLDGEEDDPRAYLAAGKESGDLEFAAAVVLFLDVATGQADEAGTCPARIAVAKSRRGRCGYVGLRFRGREGVFVADDGAARQLAPEARKATRDAEDDRSVLAAVRRNPGRAARDIRAACGIAAGRADDAIRRLLERGELATRKVIRQDAAGRRQAAAVLVLPGHPPVPGEAASDTEETIP